MIIKEYRVTLPMTVEEYQENIKEHGQSGGMTDF